MPDYTPHQRKVIESYYDRRDEIMLTKLEETVTELFLAESEQLVGSRSRSTSINSDRQM